MEGPRHPGPAEIPSLSELMDRTFRAQRFDQGERDVILGQFPQLVNEDNLDHLWVFVEGGRVVSHVGVLPRWMIIEGCRVGTALIGGVATSPEYRGRGLASQLMDSAIRQSTEEGRPLMPISGDRGLYKRLGAVGCVRLVAYSITPADAARLRDPDFVLRDMVSTDLSTVAALYRLHPVRNGRYPLDYQRALDIRFAVNRPSVFRMIYRQGDERPFAYLIAQRSKAGSFLEQIGESGGDAHAILGSIHALLESDKPAGGQTEAIVLNVISTDTVTRGMLAAAALTGTPSAHGIVLVTDPARLMKDLEAYQAERLGPRVRLRVRVDHSTATFSVGKAKWSCPAGHVSRILLESLDDPVPLPEAGPVAEALAQLTPIPLPPYGISYV